MNRHKKIPTGFTLVELAIVILIGGILTAAASMMLLNYLIQSKILTTQTRMQNIDDAIVQYLNVNGVLPCVASLTAPEDAAAFGSQITGSATPAPDCLSSAGAGSFGVAGVVVGAVPVRTLGLPDQDMADAWGDRFVYAVTDTLTTAGSYNPALGSIAVKDSNGLDVALPSGTAQYVIISHGPDRAGAYTLAGAKSSVACPTGALETPNCTFPPTTSPVTFIKTTLNSNQASTGTAAVYDDYVTFHTLLSSTGIVPSGLVAPFSATCPASGWTTYTGAGCPAGSVVCCKKD